jgi:hypothetical protein
MINIQNYIDKIDKSNINNYPFPYIIIDDFLDNNFYKELINKVYKKDLFKDINLKNNRVTKVIYNGDDYGDKSFNINNDEINLEKTYIDILLDNEIKKSIINKFIKNKNLKNNILNKHKSTMSQLDCFRGDYNYKIHTDSSSKFITLLLYLAKDNNNKNLGTNIYDSKKNMIKNIEYIPNRLVIFSPSVDHDPENNKFISYHNMMGNTSINDRRYSIQSWYLTSNSGYKEYLRYGNNSS